MNKTITDISRDYQQHPGSKAGSGAVISGLFCVAMFKTLYFEQEMYAGPLKPPPAVNPYNSHVLLFFMRAIIEINSLLAVCAWILTVCLGMGGSPDGPVSASSLRMWSVLMYES